MEASPRHRGGGCGDAEGLLQVFNGSRRSKRGLGCPASRPAAAGATGTATWRATSCDLAGAGGGPRALSELTAECIATRCAARWVAYSLGLHVWRVARGPAAWPWSGRQSPSLYLSHTAGCTPCKAPPVFEHYQGVVTANPRSGKLVIVIMAASSILREETRADTRRSVGLDKRPATAPPKDPAPVPTSPCAYRHQR